MTDVPPEIETLSQFVIVIQDREGWTPERGPAGQPVCMKGVLLEDAEAAVLACEKRMRQQVHFLPAAPLDAETTELAFIEGIAFVNAAKHEQTVDLMRVRTVREIVAELRAIASDFGNGECDHPAVAEAADLIEQRFGGEKGEQT